jgi:LemA protein
MSRLIRRLSRLAILLVAPLAVAACGVNAIPTKQERAKAQWAEVQNQYQRRADLIPNLVETVKGYAAQENNVLVAVTQARANALQVRSDAGVTTDPAAFQRYAAAQNNLSLALAPLRVLQENYPNLKSNENFMALQAQLEGTENRVAIARRDYNEAVRDYNTTLRTFPQIIWAKTMYSSAKPMQLFQATSAAQSAPQVQFGPATNAVQPPPGAAPGSPPPEPAPAQ